LKYAPKKNMPTKKSHFFDRCYAIAKQIPCGRVTSYGAIAKFIGAKSAARTVGWAMNASHEKEDIPAHRVVNKNGYLTGKHRFQGTDLMRQLLENEGVKVVDDQIQNFRDVFWDPSNELR